MGSHNGTYVNGEKMLTADLKDGDQIRAGHTILRVQVHARQPDAGAVGADRCSRRRSGPALPQIPGYVLERELGRGAMGVTYLGQRGGRSDAGRDQGGEAELSGFAGADRRFPAGRPLLTQLDHPNIVRLRESAPARAGSISSSDFVPGLNAAEILQRDGPLSVKRRGALGQSDAAGTAICPRPSISSIATSSRPT